MKLTKIFFFIFLVLIFKSTIARTQPNPVNRVVLTWDFFKNDKPKDAQADMLVLGGIDLKYLVGFVL